MVKSVGQKYRAAVSAGRIPVLKLLIDAHGFNSVRDKGYDLLCTAMKHEQHDIVKMLISGGVRVNRVNDGNSPLHSAVSSGDKVVTRMLLRHGADVNVRNDQGNSPLISAILLNKRNLIKLLVKHGADVRARDAYGDLPLAVAVTLRKPKIVEVLLQAGADVDPGSSDALSPLCLAVALGFEEIVELFLTYRAKLNVVGIKPMKKRYKKFCARDFEAAFHEAVKFGFENLVELFIRHGADVDKKDVNGKTPLFNAVGSECVFKLLLRRGAILENEVLETAVQQEITSIIEIILQRNVVDINAQHGVEKDTVLHISVINMNYDLVKLLLKNGANPNAQNVRGYTALHLAIEEDYWEYEEIIVLLFEYGACTTFRDNYGDDPLELLPDLSAAKSLVVELLAAKVQVAEETLLQLKSKYDMDFMEELPDLKYDKIISDCDITFFDVLTKRTNALVPILRNEGIVRVLKRFRRNKHKFPVYGSVIKANFKASFAKKNLLDRGCEVFGDSCGNLPRLPIQCMEKIFGFCDDTDLERFIKACK